MTPFPQSVDEMKDILPPEDVFAQSGFSPAQIAFTLLAVCLLAFLIYWIWKKIKNRKTNSKVDLETQIRKKMAVYKNGLKEGRVTLKESYFFLSQSLKEYFEDQTAIKATDMTTEEIEVYFINNSSKMDPRLRVDDKGGEKTDIISFLKHADGIKFALLQSAVETFENDSAKMLKIMGDIKTVNSMKEKA